MSSPLALPGLSLVVASRSEALPSLAGISISLLPFLALWAGGSVLLSSTGMGFFSEMCPLGEEGSCRCVCPQREALVEIWPVARPWLVLSLGSDVASLYRAGWKI